MIPSRAGELAASPGEPSLNEVSGRVASDVVHLPASARKGAERFPRWPHPPLSWPMTTRAENTPIGHWAMVRWLPDAVVSSFRLTRVPDAVPIYLPE
jgi:hypothetical protein